MLTTITPFWGRAEALTRWREAVNAWPHPDVRHLLVNYSAPGEFELDSVVENFSEIKLPQPTDGVRSIGDCLNAGALATSTKWMMKLDLDMVVHDGLWDAVVGMITSGSSDWYNLGTFYLTRRISQRLDEEPVSKARHSQLAEAVFSGRPGVTTRRLGGIQFICTVVDYLAVGGTDPLFRGYGWEDYATAYSLNRLSAKPRAISHVTPSTSCAVIRDELLEPMANELFAKDRRLAVLHHQHEPSVKTHGAADPNAYKCPTRMAANKYRVYELVNSHQ